MLRYNPRSADGSFQEVFTALLVAPFIIIVLVAAAGLAAAPLREFEKSRRPG